ncbi:Zinc finger protein [Phytophthora megakarya]|uniref:Zinc finger protein n=1 Tax=Phytophthora megakarya TaxID=4795 RepID=A0A225X2Z8_9STRA|nr:Zinc finger protein [Phytophthora megakarya]
MAVVPPSYIEMVLHICHGDVMSANLGVSKTLERVRQPAFLSGLRKDVNEFVRECSYCGAGIGSRPWRSGQMQRMPIGDLTGPLSLVVVDTVGPLVSIATEAFASKRLDTMTFVDTLVNGVATPHGIPSRLLRVKKLFVSAYHPQTQGLVGRFNGTLIRMLKMYVSEAQENWGVYLPRVLFGYRTAYDGTLGNTPFFSLYGPDTVLSLNSNKVAQNRRELHKSLRDARHVVERQLIKTQDRHEKRLQNQVVTRSGFINSSEGVGGKQN